MFTGNRRDYLAIHDFKYRVHSGNRCRFSFFASIPARAGFESEAMQPATLHSIEARQGSTAEQFPPLELVNRPTVPTEQAAYYLNRKPQTLRSWACLENGVIRPVRCNGRLAWPVAQIRAALGV